MLCSRQCKLTCCCLLCILQAKSFKFNGNCSLPKNNQNQLNFLHTASESRERTKSIIDDVWSNKSTPNIAVTNDVSLVTAVTCGQPCIDDKLQSVECTASITIRQTNQSLNSLGIYQHLSTLSTQRWHCISQINHRCIVQFSANKCIVFYTETSKRKSMHTELCAIHFTWVFGSRFIRVRNPKMYTVQQLSMLDHLYDGRSINKLQKDVILLIFRRSTFRNIHFVDNLIQSTS